MRTPTREIIPRRGPQFRRRRKQASRGRRTPWGKDSCRSAARRKRRAAGSAGATAGCQRRDLSAVHRGAEDRLPAGGPCGTREGSAQGHGLGGQPAVRRPSQGRAGPDLRRRAEDARPVDRMLSLPDEVFTRWTNDPNYPRRRRISEGAADARPDRRGGFVRAAVAVDLARLPSALHPRRTRPARPGRGARRDGPACAPEPTFLARTLPRP